MEPLAPDDETAADPAPRTSLGVVLAAVLAVAASAGLAWWFAAPHPSADVAAAPAVAPPPSAPPGPPLRFASAEANPADVRRAWTDVQQGYGDGGPEALVRGSQACARGVPADPQRLDYCLAYDTYASAVAGANPGDWFADTAARDLALARTALPEGVDARNRIDQVAALSRAVLPKAAPPKPRPQVAQAEHRPSAKPKAATASGKAVKAKPHATKAKAKAQAGRPHAVKPKAVRRPTPARPKAVRSGHRHRPTAHRPKPRRAAEIPAAAPEETTFGRVPDYPKDTDEPPH